VSKPRLPFLAWLVRRYWGEPERQGCWACVFCGHRGFTVRPQKAGFKDRWHCWHCGAWGDEADFLTLVHPNERYPTRLNRLEALRDEWESDAPAISGGDPGSHAAERPMDLRDLESAFADLEDLLDQPEWATGRLGVWRMVAHAADVAWRNHVSLDDLAGKCAQAVLDHRRSLRVHAACCDDPECGEECLAERGLVEGGNGDAGE